MGTNRPKLLELIQRCFPVWIENITLENLAGDASDRNYYRVFLSPIHPNLPRSLVVMELQGPYPKGELPFINILETLERSGLGVPRFYGDEPQEGLVLLEDLGDEILQKHIEGKGRDHIRSLYEQALDMVVEMQCGIDPSNRCSAFQIAFTVEKFVWELDFFKTNYIERLLGKRIDPSHRRVMDHLFLWLSTLMEREEKVFTHRDFHSRNLIFHAGRLKMLDFQDARMGPPQYDLASLLRDSYVVLEDVFIASCLDSYLLKFQRKTGGWIDKIRFRYLFDMTALQRNLKAIGTFAFQAVERKNPRYLRYIPNTLTSVEKTLYRYDEMTSYREVLSRYLPFGT